MNTKRLLQDLADAGPAAIVELEWLDAYSIDEWKRESDFSALTSGLPSRSVGRVVMATKKAIVLASLVNAHGDIACLMIVPTKMATALHVLRQGEVAVVVA